MSATVIHHSADFDGLFCREIARRFLPDAKLIGWDYGDPHLEFPKEGPVYVLDLSPECFWGSPLLPENIARLIWIDHHKTAIEKYDPVGWVHVPARADSIIHYKEFWRRGDETTTTQPNSAIGGYRIDGVAACRLAWQWFATLEKNTGSGQNTLTAELAAKVLPTREQYVKREVTEPLAVRLAGEYDIWDKRDASAELFQHGLRSQELGPIQWEMLLSDDLIDETFVDDLLKAGKSIQYAKARENESIIKASGFTLEFEGRCFLACNAARYNSQLFTAGLKPEHDGMLGFNWDGKQWRVSLYSDKRDVDLSPIAQKYGGGGHRGACGFRVMKLPFALAGVEV